MRTEKKLVMTIPELEEAIAHYVNTIAQSHLDLPIFNSKKEQIIDIVIKDFDPNSGEGSIIFHIEGA